MEYGLIVLHVGKDIPLFNFLVPYQMCTYVHYNVGYEDQQDNERPVEAQQDSKDSGNEYYSSKCYPLSVYGSARLDVLFEFH